jgi:hypothetical protein
MVLRLGNFKMPAVAMESAKTHLLIVLNIPVKFGYQFATS